jgi:hypothetical protein
VAEFVPIESFLGDNRLQLAKISGQHLPRDLRVVRHRHRTMNVENRTAVTVDEKRSFGRLEGVFDTFRAIMT